MRLEPGQSTEIAFRLNGRSVRTIVSARQNMADVLRIAFRLTGTHLACEQGVCGACNILADGEVVRGCLMLAVQADGRSIVTIEGLSESGGIADLQQAFVERNALQCGFCTAGMLLAAHGLLRSCPDPDRAQIRDGISGNVCRCTGYHAIVDAIEAVAIARSSASAMERTADER